MSATGTSFPDSDWPRQDPTRPDLLPPDPLLDADSFIDSTTPCGTLPPRDLAWNHRNKVDSSSTRRSPLRADPAPPNGDSTPSKKLPPSSSSLEHPDWLPSDWVLQDRVRSSGATAGTVDKYYFDPASGRRFRSKIEVLYFLETGTLRKRKKSLDGYATSADGFEEPKSKKSSSKAKSAALNFDFFNVPEKVEWVLTDPSQEAWTPFINNKKVPESTKREWVGAFHLLGRSKV